MLALLSRLFEHMYWADRRLLALLGSGAHGGEPVRLFSHLLAAERVWLLRIRGEDASHQPIWPRLVPVEMHAMAAANQTGYRRLLSGLTEGGAAEEVTYTNSQGTVFRTRVVDILTHAAMHGSYHRGQIAAAVRAAGGEPVNTDYITYVREVG